MVEVPRLFTAPAWIFNEVDYRVTSCIEPVATNASEFRSVAFLQAQNFLIELCNLIQKFNRCSQAVVVNMYGVFVHFMSLQAYETR